MNKFIVTLIFSGCFSSTVFAEVNVPARATIGSCAELLPPDQKYQLILTTNIDTDQEPQELIWSIKMDDGKGEEISDKVDDEKDKRIEPFIECMLNLVQ